MQKNNLENPDSSSSKSPVGVNETSSDWEFSGITVFRALGYVVGLLSFMVGTAIFMLGFSLSSASLVDVASILYSLAVVSICGRIVLERVKPKNEMQALVTGFAMLCAGAVIYAIICLIIYALDIF